MERRPESPVPKNYISVTVILIFWSIFIWPKFMLTFAFVVIERTMPVATST